LAAHGFTIEQMVDLVDSGLATACTERVMAGSRRLEVVRLRITVAGRLVLAGAPSNPAEVYEEAAN
jgi:hypothetical protein